MNKKNSKTITVDVVADWAEARKKNLLEAFTRRELIDELNRREGTARTIAINMLADTDALLNKLKDEK